MEGRSNDAIARGPVVPGTTVGTHVCGIFAEPGLPPTVGTHRRVPAIPDASAGLIRPGRMRSGRAASKGNPTGRFLMRGLSSVRGTRERTGGRWS